MQFSDAHKTVDNTSRIRCDHKIYKLWALDAETIVGHAVARIFATRNFSRAEIRCFSSSATTARRWTKWNFYVRPLICLFRNAFWSIFLLRNHIDANKNCISHLINCNTTVVLSSWVVAIVGNGIDHDTSDRLNFFVTFSSPSPRCRRWISFMFALTDGNGEKKNQKKEANGQCCARTTEVDDEKHNHLTRHWFVFHAHSFPSSCLRVYSKDSKND